MKRRCIRRASRAFGCAMWICSVTISRRTRMTQQFVLRTLDMSNHRRNPGNPFARTLLLLLLFGALAWWNRPRRSAGQRGWPPIIAETKPWTRWWWQGSAVDRPSLTAQLEALAAAGIGGVEVTPIYGVHGAEDRFISYLSPQWMAMLDHTLREAARLKMGVDMATGTGWPFGGPWVDDDTTARSIASQDVDARRRRTSRRASQAPAGAARARHRQPDPRRQRRRARRPAARRRADRRRSSGPKRGPSRSTDLVEPLTANRNLQALALEQVKYPRDLPLSVLMAYSDAGDALDLTSRVQRGRQPGLDRAAGSLDAVRALRRLAWQARRARGTRRRRLRDRSLLDRRHQEIPAAVRSRVRGPRPRRPSRVLQRLL